MMTGRVAPLVCLLGALALAPARAVERPASPSGHGPTVVSVAFWVSELDHVDSVKQTFSGTVFVGLRWLDPRLADPSAGRRVLPADRIWTPGAIVRNQTGGVRAALPQVVVVEPDGSVLQRQVYVGEFTQPLDLRDFPFDRHTFTLALVTPGLSTADVTFIPDPLWLARGLPAGAGTASSLSVPDWRVEGCRARPASYVIVPGVHVAGYALEVTAARAAPYYVWKVIVPLLLIVAMSWSVFFVDPTNSGTRMGIATTSMLTLIAYRFAIDTQVPRVPYMTRLDLFVITSTILVFLTLLQAVVVDNLFRARHELAARAVHRWSRRVTPAAFVAAALWALLW